MPSASHAILTVPNLISTVRLGLAVAVFVLIEWRLDLAAFVVFLVAASTDAVDGWYARRYGAVSVLGRILDPLVDKVLVCGGFILLAGRPSGPGEPPSAIEPWMAVVVVVRELLVTALRAELERSGRDFSAGLSGKLKMVVQCVAILAELLGRTGLGGTLHVVVRITARLAAFGAVALTVHSGGEYLLAAFRMLRASDRNPERDVA
jgi:CDP-diacylglycerol--glycerol-3-phosphate 3-phosphatidyltransferase